MRLPKSLMMVALWVVSIAPTTAQVINQTVPLPTTSGATLDRASAKAGEGVNLTLTLDAPTPTSLTLNGSFNGIAGPNGIDAIPFVVTFTAGAASSTVSVQIPDDVDGGEYLLSQLSRYDGRRMHYMPVTPIALNVQPLPKPVSVIPSKAVGKLDLDQKQYIRMQASPLIDLRDEFIAGANRDAADTSMLRIKMIAMLKHADDMLPVTRDKYNSLYKKPPVLRPVMFEDFHRSYQAAIVELRAVATVYPSSIRPSFVETQLAQRPRSSQESERDWKNHTLKGTYPLYVMAALGLVEENIEAYLLIGEIGVDTFSIRLASVPSGATISYKRIGEEYQALSKPTDVASTTFPYAMWTFKFEKAGCRTTERTPNPYIELHPRSHGGAIVQRKVNAGSLKSHIGKLKWLQLAIVALPIGSKLLDVKSKFVNPPLGGLDELVLPAAFLIVGGAGMLPWLMSSYKWSKSLAWLSIAGSLLCGFVYVVCVLKYVVPVPRPVGAPITVSVGSERSDFSKRFLSGRNDLEALMDMGTGEDVIQRIWTPDSIRHTRALLLFFWMGFLAMFDFFLGALTRVEVLSAPSPSPQPSPQPIDDRHQPIQRKPSQVRIPNPRKVRRRNSRSRMSALTVRPSRSSILMISAARTAFNCSTSALACPKSRKNVPTAAYHFRTLHR